MQTLKREPLPPQQQRALETVHRLTLHLGRAPSLAEVAADMGLGSKSAAQRHVDQLRKKGYLRGPKLIVRGEWALTAYGKKVLSSS